MVRSNERPSYNDDDLLTSQEIADFLHVSKVHALQLIKSGKIRGGRLGQSYKAYFKYVREYFDSVLGGSFIQASLPLKAEEADKDREKKQKGSKARRP